VIFRALGLFLAVVGAALAAVLSITVPVGLWWARRGHRTDQPETSRRAAGAEGR